MQEMSHQPLDYLDRIPDEIYRRLVTHRLTTDCSKPGQHSLQVRCLSVLAIRQYLLSAHENLLSILQNWLGVDTASVLFEMISDAQLLIRTRNNQSYTDEFILSILDWLDQPNCDLTEQSQENKIHQQLANEPMTDTREVTQRQAPENSAGNHSKPQAEHFPTDLAPPYLIDKLSQQDYLSIQSLNKAFALQRQLGWDLKKGIKNEADIKHILKFHKRIKNSKHLQSIIRMIGRNKKNDVDELPEPGMHQQSLEGTSFNNSMPNEHSVNSVTGVYQGDDIGRMIPSELVALSHEKLKMLWHARRAQQQLLNYHYQGVSSEHIAEIQQQKLSLERPGKQTVRQRGPMILCLDTSASMKGKPEMTAKAVVLEAMRVAHLEHRRCFIFSFSGSDEVVEFEFDLLSSGWQPLIDFLKFSFYGGTDINAVLEKAFDKMSQNNWSKADLVLISDGRFKIDKSVKCKMNALHRASRIFGIQVSHWNSLAFSDICHQTFSLNNV